MQVLLALLFLSAVGAIEAAPKQIKVFVALCDNKTQGIVPVGAKIGNGDDPDSNLYWGCSDGFPSYFRRSARWKLGKAEKDLSSSILRRVEFAHTSGTMNVVAEAYRGAEIRQCIADFERDACSGQYDLVAFIGHNGLMDFALPEPVTEAHHQTDVMVLCCHSESYFQRRLLKAGCRPVLMTQQLMYPGSFLIHDALEIWVKGGSLDDIRSAAAKAYARNQKISIKAATGVFSKLLK